MTMRLFDAKAVRAHAPMASVIAAVRDALLRLDRGEFEAPQRLSFGAGFGLVMPVYHAASRSLAIKSLTLDAGRTPLIKGTVSLVQSGDSDPIIADAPTVTAMRTAALVGLAADLFAAPEARKAVIFGAGAQGIEQARALIAVRPLTTLTFLSRSFTSARDAAGLLQREMPQLTIAAATEAKSHLAEADIIGCATTSREALFSAAEIKAGAFVAAIGAYRPDMHELPQDLLGAAPEVYVDDVEACLVESGEIITALDTGRLSLRQLVPLGQVVRGAPPAKGGTTVFKSVGVAPLDWAVMQVLAASAAV